MVSKLVKLKAKDRQAPVELVDHSPLADETVAASLIHTSSKLPYRQCLAAAKKLSKKYKQELFRAAFVNLQFYDSMLREFEFVYLTYNIILSSACFGQLKRHRMATITSQRYDPSLGITVPDSIIETGLEKDFRDIAARSEEVYLKINKVSPAAAPYILTNAHRKRVLCRVNARELYHLVRLRDDAHAQWDIRNVAALMGSEAKKAMPLTFELLCGKDKYNETYKHIFGKAPKVVEAVLPGKREIK
jgi:thymidylate synthase ThyX